MHYASAKWFIPTIDEQAAESLVRELNISPALARVLVVRGMKDIDEASRFLYAGEDQLHDPFLLDGMDNAVARIAAAIEQRELIRIYGDYDADGISSTSLLIGVMNTLGARFDYYIPHRQTEGYGLNRAAIDKAADQGVSLIITVDTGISAAEEVEYATSRGIETIITDHHEPPHELPLATAIINPRKPSCPYPFKSLAGVGVAFKLATALLGRIPSEWYEYVALGTIADLMPLIGENRILVKQGLASIRTTNKLGIRALLDVAGIDIRAITSGHIGFSVAPRINASGRLERADMAVHLLTTDDEQEAEQLARDLDRLNRERQQIVEEIADEALEQVRARGLTGHMGKTLVVAGSGWNVGVVGIVASKVLEKHYRPTIILSIDPSTGKAKGSARSIPGFDIHAALEQCGDLLEHYGGHKAAAGMTLDADNIEALRHRLDAIAEQTLSDEDMIPIARSDMEILLEEITTELIDDLERLGPFGIDNPHPYFVINGLRMKESRLLGKDRQHLKLIFTPIEKDNPQIEAIAFGRAEWTHSISPHGKIDVYGELSINEWNGLRRPQLLIKDLRVMERQVFDWRGKVAADGAVREWLTRDNGKQHPSRGAMIFRSGEEDLLRESGEYVAIWQVRPDGTLEAANGLARATSPVQITDLMILTLPTDIDRFSKAMAEYRHAERIYAVFHDTRAFLSGPNLTREQFASVYGLLATRTEPLPVEETVRAASQRTALTADSVRYILAVFDELGFIHLNNNTLTKPATMTKRELHHSSIYMEKLCRDEVERDCIFTSSAELKEWIVSMFDTREHSQSAMTNIS